MATATTTKAHELLRGLVADGQVHGSLVDGIVAGINEYVDTPTDLSALRLQALEPTGDLAIRCEILELELADAMRSGGQRRAQRVRLRLVEAERRLKLGEERDRLAESRKRSCWCLGAGGRGVRNLPLDGEIIEVLQEYCSCRDGQIRKHDDDKIRERYRKGYKGRRVQRIIRQSGLEDLEIYRGLTWRNHPDRRAVQICAEWLDMPKPERPWLLACGLVGRGKTALMAGLAWEIAERGDTVIFTTVSDMLSRLRSGFDKDSDDTEGAYLDAFRNVPYLFLDDIGAERATDYAGERLLQIINHRHNKRLPTAFTSNLMPTDENADIDLRRFLDARIFGRIKRLSQFVPMTGRDLRDPA